MYGGFGDDVGVEPVAEVDGVYVITVDASKISMMNEDKGAPVEGLLER